MALTVASFQQYMAVTGDGTSLVTAQSTNVGVHNSQAVCTVIMPTVHYGGSVRIQSDGEAGFDGAQVYLYDYSDNATLLYDQIALNTQTVDVTFNFTSATKMVEMWYKKDSSDSAGADRAIFTVTESAAPIETAAAPTALSVIAYGTATAPTSLFVGNISTPTAPTRLDMLYADVRASAQTALSVIAYGTASAQTALSVTSAAHAPEWRARCLIGGVDVSERLTGVTSVVAEEGAARIASVVLKPTSGTIAPLDYVGKTIEIDFVRLIGSVEVPFRLFTGRVDTPSFDPNVRLLQLDCVDDLQNRVAALPRNVLDWMIGGHYTKAVQGDLVDTWDYALARLSTVAASLDAGPHGGLRVTPWELSGTWRTYNESTLLDAQSRITYPQRSTLVNRVDIEFDYRYPRLRQRYTSVGWSGTQIDMAPCGWNYPQQQDIAGAAGAAGWHITHEVYWPAPVAIPHSSGGFIKPSEGSIDMAVIFMTQRHSQTVTERYALTVTAPESVSANGELAHGLRGALASAFDGNNWESALDIAPQLTGPEMDYAPDAPRADSDYAIETLLAQARVKILGSHRGARVGNAVLCEPDLDLDKRVAVSTSGMSAAGKVARVAHLLDFSGGSAVTEFEVACFGVGGSGLVMPSTLAAPVPPAQAAATHDWPAEIPALTVNTYGVTPYQDGLMGLLLNPPETYSVEDVPGVGTKSFPNPFYVTGSYPVSGFRVRMPGVDDADRNPIEKTVAQAYQVVITSDTLSFTIP